MNENENIFQTIGVLVFACIVVFIIAFVGYSMGWDSKNKEWKRATAKHGCIEYSVDTLTGDVKWDWKLK